MATMASTFNREPSAQAEGSVVRAGKTSAQAEGSVVRVRRTSAADIGRTTLEGAATTGGSGAQDDTYTLRALPNDSIYFYSKKIDNSRIVRQADPGARGECWAALGAAGVLMMIGVSIIAPHVGSVLAGYRLEVLKQERQTLLDQKRALDVKEATLLTPERLNDLARVHSLGSPAAAQVIHLDPQAGEGSFARNQAPPAPDPAPSRINAQQE